MNKITTFTLYLFIALPCFAESWSLHDSNVNENNVVINLSKDSNQSFAQVLNSIPGDKILFAVNICCLTNINDNRIHSEITAYYESYLTKQFNSALNSTGNLHNPKLVPLSNSFNIAIKSTSLYRYIENILLENNYKIQKIEHEKFSILKNNEEPKYHADVWLHVAKSI